MRATVTIFALWAAGLGAAAQFGKISVLYEVLGQTYAGHSAMAIGLVVSIVGTVGLIFGTTAGLWVTRIGPRRAVLAALVLGAGVSAVQMLLPPYGVLLATRVLEGVSHLAIVVVGPTVISGLASARYQGAAMTLWSSFFGVTYAALFYFGPGIVAGHGPAGLFGLHAGWMGACALALWALLPPDPKAPPVPNQGSLLAQHRAIYASPFEAAPAMGFVCYTVTYVAILTLLPALIGPEWGGFVGVAMPLVSIAVSLSFGVWLLRFLPAWRVVQSGFIAAILATVCLWLAWGNALSATGFALIMAAALGVVQGASFASLAQLNPSAEARARGAGAIAQLGNLGTTTGTPMLVWLIQHGGIHGFALFLIGFSGLGVAVHAAQARRRISG